MTAILPQARPVREGSVLAIVAPSSPFNREDFDEGVRWLRERYEVRFDGRIYEATGFLAGDDNRRLAELTAAIADPEVDAILCARGGYGATRLLPKLDVRAVAESNKLVVGFSDITALHALWDRAGVRSIHAPMVSALGRAPEAARVHWREILEGTSTPGPWHGQEVIVEGECEGRFCGGNLAVLGALLGTPYAPDVEGCVLFLEDIGERPYRLDRLLTSMLHAGWFERCAGVVLGTFTDGNPGDDGVTVEDVLRERLGGLAVPVVGGLPAGHIDDNEPLVFGRTVRISGDVVEYVSE